jgi:S-adenosylmethionine:diacylglycerol 3-amino-3-carboxypropyl transferase
MRRDFDQPARFFESFHVFAHCAFKTAGNAACHDNVSRDCSDRPIAPNHEEPSAAGFARDRSGIYGGFHCYGRR